ncbi:MAG: AAA family ATPase [Methanobacteriaceae archaeon]|nr:AAA family ATPase [Methanobacteriaceae archaeon]
MENETELIDYILTKQNKIKKIVNNNLYFNNEKLDYRIEYYRIKNHIDQFLNKEYYNRFIVMPGLRGVGKTTIMLQIYDYLIQNGVENKNILYFDVRELKGFYDFDIYTTINSFLINIHQTDIVSLNKKIFLLIDEAHFDKKWASAGKVIYDQSKNIFMIFTGSSALDLEINADVERRIKREEIYPLNFPEFLQLKYKIPYPENMSAHLKNIILNGNEESIILAKKEELKLQNDYALLKEDSGIEFENYLFSKGFPFTLNLKEFEIHDRIVKIVNNVIENDISSLKSFNSNTYPIISRIITYLAMQKPGGTSNIKLAQSLGVSPKTVNDILNILEKTQLIFSVKPFGTGGKVVKKPWEFFFLSPCIKASINYELGRYSLNHKKCLATLSETLVISLLFKLKDTSNSPLGLFYDSEKGGVDFLIKYYDTIIPLEVGVGNKTKSQLTKAINRYNSNYGILVSNRTPLIKKESNIIYIPLKTFSYL